LIANVVVKVERRKVNQAVQRTGASQFAEAIELHRRLVSVADLIVQHDALSRGLLIDCAYLLAFQLWPRALTAAAEAALIAGGYNDATK